MSSENEQKDISKITKKKLLEQLQGELAAWRQTRRWRQRATLSLGILLVIGTGVIASLKFSTGQPAELPAPALATNGTAEVQPVAPIAAVNSSNEAGQYSAIKVERIDDASLLSILNDLGQPSFFATVDGKKRLIRGKL